MFKTPPTVLAVFTAIGVLAGCSSHLKLIQQEPGYVLDLRQEYFAANPNGENNVLIGNGEVIAGMSALEVLCAWGHPDQWRKRSPTTELWIYRDVDVDTKDWVQFDFVFKDGVLFDWELRRHFANGGSIDLPAVDDTYVLTRGSTTTGKRIPGN